MASPTRAAGKHEPNPSLFPAVVMSFNKSPRSIPDRDTRRTLSPCALLIYTLGNTSKASAALSRSSMPPQQPVTIMQGRLTLPRTPSLVALVPAEVAPGNLLVLLLLLPPTVLLAPLLSSRWAPLLRYKVKSLISLLPSTFPNNLCRLYRLSRIWNPVLAPLQPP